MEGYLTIQEVAKKWEISVRRANTLCNSGRVTGATKFGNVWAIPESAVKPSDGRVHSGKYIKKTDC